MDSLCKQKVLTKLDKNEVTECLNSFVNVDKEDTTLRVCLDPSGLNPYIIRPVFNSYTLDEISYMQGVKWEDTSKKEEKRTFLPEKEDKRRTFSIKN